MADPLQALLGAGAVPTTNLPPTSRYAGIGTATYEPRVGPGEEAVPIAYLRRRLVPKPETFALLNEYSCVEGDRRDTVAAQQLSDPEWWWRIADANGVIDPSRMTEPPGRTLRITTERGVPGGTLG